MKLNCIYILLISIFTCCHPVKMVFIINKSKQAVTLKITEQAQLYYFGKLIPFISLDATGKGKKLTVRSFPGRWTKADRLNFYELLQKSSLTKTNDTLVLKNRIYVYRVNFHKELMIRIK